jgi:aryl-alcohol dehydrogenase-like predicted oxidoreductase
LDADDFRRSNPRFQGDNFARNLALVAKVTELAKQKGVAPSQLALAWVLAQGEHIVPIPGTKRRRYLEENIAAAELTLSQAELAAIEAVFPAEAVAGNRYSAESMTYING